MPLRSLERRVKELVHEGILTSFDLIRTADRQDLAFIDDRNAIGHSKRQVPIM